MHFKLYLLMMRDSFHSLALYRYMAEQWNRSTFGYILFTAFVQTLVLYSIMIGIIHYHLAPEKIDPQAFAQMLSSEENVARKSSLTIRESLYLVISRMPELIITQGKASTVEKQPYIVEDPFTKKILLYVGTATELREPTPNAWIVVSQDGLYLNSFDPAYVSQKSPDSWHKIINFSSLPHKQKLAITPATLMQAIKQLKQPVLYSLMVLIGLPLSTLLLMVYMQIHTLVATFPLILGQAIFSYNYTIWQLVRVAALIITPGFIISEVISISRWLWDIHLPSMQMVITIAYTVFAIRALLPLKQGPSVEA